MNGNASRTPPALVRNLAHNKVLHKKVIFVTVKTRQIPYVSADERCIVEPLRNGFTRVKLYFGYMEEPNIPRELMNIDQPGFSFDPKTATYFLGRETIIADGHNRHFAKWRRKLFSLLSKNARSATSFFGIPPNRVVELGEQVSI
jgi:KUP system potassium uptake protein